MVNFDEVNIGDFLFLDIQHHLEDFYPSLTDGESVRVHDKDVEDDEGCWPMISAKTTRTGRHVRLGPGWFRHNQ